MTCSREILGNDGAAERWYSCNSGIDRRAKPGAGGESCGVGDVPKPALVFGQCFEKQNVGVPDVESGANLTR